MGRGRDALSMGSSVGALAARRVITAASAATGVGKQAMSAKRSRRSQGNYGVDVRQFRRRFVALELMYIGWAYHGFAAQFVAEKKEEQDEDADGDAAAKNEGAILLREEEHPTVEGMLFRALRRARLVDDGDTLQDLKYTKCGRTDRGVSALGQVVALRLRSRQPRTSGTVSHGDDEDERNVDDEEDRDEGRHRDETRDDVAGISTSAAAGAGDSDEEATIPAHEEMDYVAMLNRGLPADVRVLGWTDVPEDFSARFSCSWRQYKYFFTFDPGSGSSSGGGGRGAIDIEAMQQAAKLLEGTHDFRNLCKMDVENVLTFERTILMSRIEVENEAANLFSYNVRGTAFLYNQVRCIMAVLMMVGKGQEKPDVISSLLDVHSTPRKPEYVIADPEQLILYAVGYDANPLKWRRPAKMNTSTLAVLLEAQRSMSLRNAMLSSCHRRIATDETINCSGGDAVDSSAPDAGMKLAATVTAASIGIAGERHVPLLKRRMEPSFEEKKEKFETKARVKRDRSDKVDATNDEPHAMSVD